MADDEHTHIQIAKPKKSWLYRIFRAAIIGAILYLILFRLPIFNLKITAAKPSNSSSPAEIEDPIYRDENGKRVHQSEYENKIGYDRAKTEGITSHAACKRLENIYYVRGCQRYITEQKHIPPHIKQGNFGSGKSTEQCRAEVNAYYEPLIQDMREQGDDVAARSRTNRDWAPELKECQNYDNIRIGKVIYDPTSRLQDILNKVKQGGTITPEDRLIVNNDLTDVLSFPDHPAKKAYLEKYEYFSQLVNGKVLLKTN